MIVLVITFISFIFEYVFNFLFHNSIFLPLTILTTLVLLEPYFDKKKNLYYVYSFIIGFLYDFVYTGNYFMDSGLFLIVAVVASFISSNMPNNFFVFLIKLLFLIAFYRVLSFLLFFVNGMIDFSFSLLFKSIYCSLVLNVFYGIILYFILYFVFKKFGFKRIK